MADETYEKIQQAIDTKGKYKEFNITYDMSEDLDNILTQGKVRIEYADFKTEVLISPTYLDIVVVVNDWMNIEDFGDHHYLESIDFLKKDGDIKARGSVNLLISGASAPDSLYRTRAYELCLFRRFP